MSQTKIKQLRLAQYSEMLGSIFASDCRLNIIAADSASRIFSWPRIQADIDVILQAGTSGTPAWSTVNKDVEIYVGAKTFLLLRMLVKLGSEEREYWLSALFPVKLTEESREDIKIKSLMLGHVSEFVCVDYTNSVMLDGMAHELAIRYEELNVIYGIEDINTSHDGKRLDENLALTRLIENCLDYLPVDLAAIILPSENRTISNISEELGAIDSEALLDLFSSNVLDTVKANGETLVVNRDEVTDWTDLDIDLPIKFIVSPIFSLNNDVAGIFIFANKMDKVNFTNSDRKLCDVFAVEVTNILKINRDPLTGLLNRRGLEEKLNRAIEDVNQNNVQYSLIHFDIDQFKIVNDTNGYSVGDKLLQRVGMILQAQLDDSAVIARINVDEYTILLKDCSVEKAELISKNIQRAMKEIQFISADVIFDTNLSIGIIEITGADPADSSTILKASLIACEAAKNMGGNRIRVYNSSDNDLKEQHNLMHNADQINEALQNNKFVLYAQAIIAADDKGCDRSHYEVLIRMLDHDNNIVSPGLFIPAAERYKMMKKLDKWVVCKTLDTLSEYNQQTGDNSLKLSINISGQSLSDDRFKIYIANKIAKSKVKPAQLCFEVTETSAIANLTEAMSFIQMMRELGCSFALDDFGSGMSSFNYLKHLPVDYLKIDGCFVKYILENDIDAVMVNSINSIGHALGLLTVAEFVENREIQDALVEIGVDYLQGYGLHKPEPLHDILSRNLLKLSAEDYPLSEAAG